MKKIAIICLLFINGCVIVVDETEEGVHYHDDNYHDHYDECDDDVPNPYEYDPEYCDVSSEGECCEWYTGNGCHERYCFYGFTCEWDLYETRCEVTE